MKAKMKLSKITSLTCLLTVIVMVLVAGTYSKYASTVSGTSSSVIASWSFLVNGEEIAVAGTPKTIEFGLFNTVLDSNGAEEKDVQAGKIAPGTSGSFQFNLENTSDVTVQYSMDFDVTNSSDIPIEFSLDGTGWNKQLDSITPGSDTVMAINGTQAVTIRWRWIFNGDSAVDTALGIQEPAPTITVKATINVTQADASDAAGVIYEEKPVFPNILTDFQESYIANSSIVKPAYSAFAYQTVDLFAGKTISKIGIPIKEVSAINDDQTFTIHVVDKHKVASLQKADPIRTYVVSPKKEDLGSDAGAVNKWVYIDLTDENIVLSEDETLAFGSTTDTVKFGYNGNSNPWEKHTAYSFCCRVEGNNPSRTGEDLLFDVYYKEPKQPENANNLKNALAGKTMSILGDSISTFAGYSNNMQNNNTIGSNAVWYSASTDKGITDVNDSWWMQTINNNGMKLLVNNSWSGSTVFANTNNQGVNSIAYSSARPVNLHDNTEDAAFANGTEPDIIAVYIGINDFNTNIGNLGNYDQIDFDALITDNGGSYSYGTPTTITEAYAVMVHRMKTRYTSSDIYLFTMLPNTKKKEYDKLEIFNESIKKIADKYDLTAVDLYKDSGITKDNTSTYLRDGLHPNSSGMDKITATFEKALEKNYLNN